MILQEHVNQDLRLFALKNKQGTLVKISNLGASIVSIFVKDKEGTLQDVVLGYKEVQDYFSNTETYFGATVGRNANRTAKALVTIGGEIFSLPKNEGEKNLHSGPHGYQIRTWKVREIDEQKNILILALYSPDGDQGFPGNLEMTAHFQLTEENELIIDYRGVSDKATIFNPTNHSYFNLNGQDSGSIEQHLLTLQAEAFTPITADSIPTGEIRPVESTPFDFRKEKTIGKDIDQDEEQLLLAKGYDHNFTVTPGFDEPIATAKGDKSGIQLQVFTNLPGVQLYTGNYLDGQAGKCGSHHDRDGFCLETQFFPDATHHENFPSPIIPAQQEISRKTIYKFSLV